MAENCDRWSLIKYKKAKRKNIRAHRLQLFRAKCSLNWLPLSILTSINFMWLFINLYENLHKKTTSGKRAQPLTANKMAVRRLFVFGVFFCSVSLIESRWTVKKNWQKWVCSRERHKNGETRIAQNKLLMKWRQNAFPRCYWPIKWIAFYGGRESIAVCDTIKTGIFFLRFLIKCICYCFGYCCCYLCCCRCHCNFNLQQPWALSTTIKTRTIDFHRDCCKCNCILALSSKWNKLKIFKFSSFLINSNGGHKRCKHALAIRITTLCARRE